MDLCENATIKHEILKAVEFACTEADTVPVFSQEIGYYFGSMNVVAFDRNDPNPPSWYACFDRCFVQLQTKKFCAIVWDGVTINTANPRTRRSDDNVVVMLNHR
jgi:hypothetical protein